MSKHPNNPQAGQQRRDDQPRQAGGQTDAMRQQQQFEAGEGGRFAAQIRERMQVIGADGQKVGSIDRVEGDRIKLSRDDWQGSDGKGQPHYLPLGQVQAIEGDKVRLTLDFAKATSMATTG
jgi:hypothetical protein